MAARNCWTAVGTELRAVWHMARAAKQAFSLPMLNSYRINALNPQSTSVGSPSVSCISGPKRPDSAETIAYRMPDRPFPGKATVQRATPGRRENHRPFPPDYVEEEITGEDLPTKQSSPCSNNSTIAVTHNEMLGRAAHRQLVLRDRRLV